MEFELDVGVNFLLFQSTQKGGDYSIIALCQLLRHEVCLPIFLPHVLHVLLDPIECVSLKLYAQI